MGKLGKLYVGKPLHIKSRRELLQTIKPQQWGYLRRDNGDMPDTPSLELNPPARPHAQPGPTDMPAVPECAS
jgi:hypothetical protein